MADMSDSDMVERLEAAIRAEFTRQFAEVYMWDPADEGLFAAGAREWDDFDSGRLADRFDLTAVVAAVLAEMREPTVAMIDAGSPTRALTVYSTWRVMIAAALGQKSPLDASKRQPL